jgi:hypothetical protein
MNGICSQVYLMNVLSLLWLYYCYPFVASQGMPMTCFYHDILFIFEFYLELDASALCYLG